MFTIEQIHEAHSKVKSGADFPNYIQDIRKLGVESFVTFVADSHTEYFGKDGLEATSDAKYNTLEIAPVPDIESLKHSLKIHQKGETDYFTFCREAAAAGVIKWIVSMDEMTCVYYDNQDAEMVAEIIPQPK